MELALLGALTIGLSLGLFGSGGSILTVPVLLYLVGESEKLAIAESLAIVGLIAAVGAVPYARRGLVEWNSVLWFGLPGMVGAYLGAAISPLLSGGAQLMLFAVIMVGAALLMLRPPKLVSGEATRHRFKIALDGLLVGALTGLVGVGGGFLIVPALVLLGGLPMHRAVGTSLAIIALKSGTGFLKYREVLAEQELYADYRLILLMSAIGILGAFAGNRIGRHVPKERLARLFAIFLLLVAAAILYDKVPGLIE